MCDRAILFPRYAKSYTERIAKWVFGKTGFIDSDRYTSKCFRRVRSDAAEYFYSTLGEISKSPGRNAECYRPYLLLRKDEEARTDSPIRPLDIPD